MVKWGRTPQDVFHVHRIASELTEMARRRQRLQRLQRASARFVIGSCSMLQERLQISGLACGKWDRNRRGMASVTSDTKMQGPGAKGDVDASGPWRVIAWPEPVPRYANPKMV